MSDILADAREWLADEAIGGRLQTHSGECHRWHPACLVARLLRELDSRAGSTGDSDADHPERENADHDAAPTARVSDRQCAGHADIGGTIPDAEPAATACDSDRPDNPAPRPAGTGDICERLRLTDAERHCLREVRDTYADEDDVACNEIAAVLDGLLERTR